jgi:hypothetical protein
MLKESCTQRRRMPVAARMALAGLLAAACGESPSEPRATPGQAQEMMLLSMAATGGWISGPPGSGPRQVQCPAGGTIASDGSVDIAEDGDVLAITFLMTATHQACAVLIDQMRIVTTGHTHIEGATRMRRPAAAGQPAILLSHESHQTGEMTTTHDGQSITCAFDITQSYDPVANTLHIRGTSCGHTIDLVRPGPLRP